MFSAAELAALDATLPVPLYHQLYLLLRRKIEAGELGLGQLLPGELRLAAQFGVARVTARHALERLRHDGLVQRSRGRGRGTAVQDHQVTRMLRAPLNSMQESLDLLGRETVVELLEFERVRAPEQVAQALHLAPGAEVDRAVRLRRLEGQPFAHYLSYTLPLGPGFNARALRQGSRLELFKRLGIELAEIEQVLSAVAADATVAQRLQTTVGSPLLSVTRTYSDIGGRQIDHVIGLYRPDRFQYQMRLSATRRPLR